MPGRKQNFLSRVKPRSKHRQARLQSRTLSINLTSLLLNSQPGWRNWQTQRTQNPPGFGPWGFDSPSRHHYLTPCNL